MGWSGRVKWKEQNTEMEGLNLKWKADESEHRNKMEWNRMEQLNAVGWTPANGASTS